uniref:Ssu-2 homolog n=1 Tax=Anas platyrhynchos platyrhynchos TaxID=8840 RepID=U3I5E5_ANAPP
EIPAEIPAEILPSIPAEIPAASPPRPSVRAAPGPLCAPLQPQGGGSAPAPGLLFSSRVPVPAARTALLRFVATRHCYGSRAAAELHIQELRPRVTYRYRLETFSESRLSEWAFEPFTSKCLPPGDIPPDLWDVEVGVPPLFQGQTRRCRVPRSALVRECHRCHGRGRSQCGACHGAGRVRSCGSSHQEGSRRRLKQQKRCQLCSGTGRSRCSTCSGRGSKTCTTCQGEKKLRHFRQLVITWRNNVFEFVSEHHPNFPGELLSKVSGENIFQDENVVVCPIVDFPEPAISRASRRAIAEHSAAFASSSRILRQVKGGLGLPGWHHGELTGRAQRCQPLRSGNSMGPGCHPLSIPPSHGTHHEEGAHQPALEIQLIVWFN